MAFGKVQPQDSALGDINTTPLIDVMLVLLIMFVITIPASTHVNDFDLPTGPSAERIDPVMNRVAVTHDNAIKWNDNPVSEPQLAALLGATRRLPVEPELQFAPQPQAGYALTASVLNVVKQSGVTKFGFVGNEAFSEFNKPQN